MKTKSHKMCVKFRSTLFLNIRTIFRRATDEIKKKNNSRTCYRNTPSLKMIKTTFSYPVENGEDLVLPVNCKVMFSGELLNIYVVNGNIYKIYL